MKKLFFLFSFLFFAVGIELAAQTVVPGIPDGAGFGSIGAVVALTLFVTEVIKGLVTLKGFVAQLISWIVGIVVSFFGWKLNLGIFEDVGFYEFLFYGIAITLASNGIFKVPVIKVLLDTLFNYLNNQKAVESKE